MQSFIKVKEKKNKKCSLYVGNEETVERIKSYINENKIFFIHGLTGCGKTHIIRHCTRGFDIVYLTYSTLKSKLKMRQFITSMEGTNNIVIIDDFDALQKSDFFGWKELVELKYKITNKSTIIIGKYNKKFKDLLSVEVPPPTIDDILQLIPGDCQHMTKIWKQCDGDMRMLFHNYKDGWDYTKDNFKTPKELVNVTLRNPKNKDLFRFIAQGIEEHGYIWSSIHGNYTFINGKTDHALIAKVMSDSDILDLKIYNESWSYMPYFIASAIVTPNMLFEQKLKKEIKPGSAWTKHNNYRMKYKKLMNITQRTTLRREDLYYLHYIKPDVYDLSTADFKFIKDLNTFTKKEYKKTTRKKSK